MAIDEAGIIDQLYGLPLGEFTTARNEAARELRKAGDREAAERVKTLRKPTAAAGAVNRLVREHRAEVEDFLRASAVLRDAQFSGKGDLAAATRQEHAELDGLLRMGGEAVRQTLLAAAVDDDAAQQLLEARLERELEPRGFGTLLAHAPAAPRKPRAASAAPAKPASATAPRTAQGTAGRKEPSPAEWRKPDDGPARLRLSEAKSSLRAAEAEERQARRHWDETRTELEKARAAVDEAQSDLDRLNEG